MLQRWIPHGTLATLCVCWAGSTRCQQPSCQNSRAAGNPPGNLLTSARGSLRGRETFSLAAGNLTHYSCFPPAGRLPRTNSVLNEDDVEMEAVLSEGSPQSQACSQGRGQSHEGSAQQRRATAAQPTALRWSTAQPRGQSEVLNRP